MRGIMIELIHPYPSSLTSISNRTGLPFPTEKVLGFIFGMSNLSSAMMCSGENEKCCAHQKMAAASTEHKDTAADTTQQTASEEPVDVGNKICPVSGETIVEETKVTYEYEGKIYNFCCKACIKDFKKDPQKYIEKLEALKEKEKEKEGAGEHEGHSGDEHSGHEGHHH